MNPLEKAMQGLKTKTCLTCENRVEINGVSYCIESGKILHPMLLDPEYPSKCPHDKPKEDDSE